MCEKKEQVLQYENIRAKYTMQINDFYTNDKLPFYSILLFIRFINGIDFSKKRALPKGIYYGTSLKVSISIGACSYLKYGG